LALLKADYFSLVLEIARKLGISEQSQVFALDILRRAREKRVTAGRHPAGLAAAALYIGCLQGNHERATQQKLADAAGVCCVVVRRDYILFWKKLDLPLPDFFEQ
jgi:transcription initiation factor TFIIB